LVLRGQVIPSSRTVDWSLAGLSDTLPEPSIIINVSGFGAAGDGVTINDLPVQNAISSAGGNPAVIFFPGGTYLFNSSLTIPSYIIIRGDSSSLTTLRFDLAGASSDLFRINGSISTLSYPLISDGQKGNDFILVNNSGLTTGDYFKLYQNDSSIITSSWALNCVAQIIQVKGINGDTLFLKSPLRKDYSLSDFSRIKKIIPKVFVGFECFTLERMDSTAAQTSNFDFDLAANCWIKGVESNRTNFAHVAVSRSTNLLIRGNYFHHAFAYGGGGQAYGVLLQFSSGESLVENNIFKNLRHSMLLQAGANGNVFGYNYSLNPFWTEGSFPANSAGDMVLHGNYVFANLFEGNICQNIVIDDSHGINGPFNTFFRNRAASYGIIMNNNPASNDQNFVGNEITSTGFLMGNYALNGTGHFQYGNIVRGNLTPAGTTGLNTTSYYRDSAPGFFGASSWPSFGPPLPYNTGTIPAQSRYNSGAYVVCSEPVLDIPVSELSNQLKIFPNPNSGEFRIQCDRISKSSVIEILDLGGKKVLTRETNNVNNSFISLKPVENGVYLILIKNEAGMIMQRSKLILVNE
jgi:hypothetical protein